MKEMTGRCIYCGQQKIVEASNQREADQMATAECVCDNPQRRARKCHENIERICGEAAADLGMELVTEEVIENIKDAGTLCVHGHIETATFRLADSTLTIKRTKDAVAVSRKKVLSAKLEA